MNAHLMRLPGISLGHCRSRTVVHRTLAIDISRLFDHRLVTNIELQLDKNILAPTAALIRVAAVEDRDAGCWLQSIGARGHMMKRCTLRALS